MKWTYHNDNNSKLLSLYPQRKSTELQEEKVHHEQTQEKTNNKNKINFSMLNMHHNGHI